MQKTSKTNKLSQLYRDLKSLINKDVFIYFSIIVIACLYILSYGFLNFLIIKLVIIFIFCFNHYYNLLHFTYVIGLILHKKYKSICWAPNRQKYTSFDLGTVNTFKDIRWRHISNYFRNVKLNVKSLLFFEVKVIC